MKTAPTTITKNLLPAAIFTTLKRTLLLISGILLNLAAINTVAANSLTEYTLEYAAEINGIELHAIRSLKNDGDHYTIQQKAEAVFASVDETSTFTLTNDKIFPLSYDYNRSIIGAKRSYAFRFDNDTHQAIYTEKKKDKTVKLPDTAFDYVNYQLQIRRDLMRYGNAYPETNYPTAYRGRIKNYHFQFIGEETVETPLGKLDTIIIERKRNSSDKTTRMWLAKDWEYILVKMRHTDDGDSHELNLLSGTLGQTPIKGK